MFYSISEVFAMGKLHKDLATYIIQCAEDETKSNQLVIKVRYVFPYGTINNYNNNNKKKKKKKINNIAVLSK